MIAYTFLVLPIGLAMMALVFGLVEGYWSDNNIKFNHGRQTYIRVFLGAALFGVAQIIHPSWSLFLLIPGMPWYFALLHRLVMNISRKHVPWYYLGPHIRGPKESEYDTFWWERAAVGKVVSTKFAQGQPTWSVAYAVPRRWLPFLYANIHETCWVALSVFTYSHFDNP